MKNVLVIGLGSPPAVPFWFEHYYIEVQDEHYRYRLPVSEKVWHFLLRKGLKNNKFVPFSLKIKITTLKQRSTQTELRADAEEEDLRIQDKIQRFKRCFPFFMENKNEK